MMSSWFIRTILALVCLCRPCLADDENGFHFDGSMSRETLESYLSRAVTHIGLCSTSADPTTDTFDDDLRMLLNIGARFVGRTAFVWDLPPSDAKHFDEVRAAAKKVHQADPGIILQACVFEAVFPGVKKIAIPQWVFEEFGLPAEKRSFNYEAMLYRDGRRVGQWRKVGSVPDMSQLETRMWFYYRSRRYIDCGMEAIHLGQVMIMNEADPGHRHWFDLLKKIRSYAKVNARRRFVLCDAHTRGVVEDGKLLFDFHSYPLRIREWKEPEQGVLPRKHPGAIYGRSKGGISPSGWSCQSLPYLVEFDNWGYSGRGGEKAGGIWVWGYDEMSWFAHQDQEYRAWWLRYAINWLKEQDPNGFLQIPTRRKLAAPVENNLRIFAANRRSPACPDGFGLEPLICEIWGGE